MNTDRLQRPPGATSTGRRIAEAAARVPSRLAWALPLMVHPATAAPQIPAKPALRPHGPDLLWTALLRRTFWRWARRQAPRPGLRLHSC